MKNSKFARDEDGALLVFFAMCAAAIFLVAALSFDVGRRASTQTDLQSFVDNVALAAAGELDAGSDAIARAKIAANELIIDKFTFGESVDDDGTTELAGLADFNIFFYQILPPKDVDPLVGALDENLPASNAIAQYVHVSLYPESGEGAGNDYRVNVPWVFARLLRVFGGTLPPEEVGAEATAGTAVYACGIAPVFFCAPGSEVEEGNVQNGTWPEIGSIVHLRDDNGKWSPGNFSFLDVDAGLVAAGITDKGGVCDKYNSTTDIYNCLIAAASPVTNCLPSGAIFPLTGNRNGIAPVSFNARLDMYKSTVNKDDDNFPSAPLVAKGYVEGDTCGPGDNETKAPDTVDFPPDDCYLPLVNVFGRADNKADPNECEEYNGEIRFGNKQFDYGRLAYVEQNYSKDALTFNATADILDISNQPFISVDEVVTVTNDGIAERYHVDDPFRPEAFFADGRKAVRPNPDFPEILFGSSRWDYYRAEVAASYYDNPTDVYDPFGLQPDFDLLEGERRSPALELIDELYNVTDVDTNSDEVLTFAEIAIWEASNPDDDVYDRKGASLPICSTEVELNPVRRILTAAIVNCDDPETKKLLTGQKSKNKGGILPISYVDFFITSVFGGPSTPGSNDVYVEVVGPSDQAGSYGVNSFIPVTQLYE